MRILRYIGDNSESTFGWLQGERIGKIDGSPYAEFRRREPDINLHNIKLLSPVSPTKIVCIGRNYAAHAKERNAEVPEVPLIFLKPPSSIIGHEDNIILPPQSNQVDHEAELVVIIGKTGRWISPDDAMKHVFGYSIGNDVTARDLQRSDGQWTRAKGFDTFCPIGPWVETEFDPSDALITCNVNEELRQMASTRDMVFNVKQLIAYISSVMTLTTGDAIFTGTPSGIGPIVPGDYVEITIEGIGTLTNTVTIDRI